MTMPDYISGRKQYSRPQALLWTDSYQIDTGLYLPVGTEYEDFIILSDHNRSEISVSVDRIENRKRMINGTMRSYFVAQKEKFSFSWNMLPSRAYDANPSFDPLTGLETVTTTMHTADGGAGGWDVHDWYKSHSGPFYMLLSYDSGAAYGNTYKYVRAVHVYFASFEHTVVKRGITDFWNVSVELEEV